MRDWCVIVPFHKPELSGHVARTVIRQTCRPRWVVVVGNGQGRDGLTHADRALVEGAGLELHHCRCPIAHPSHARNRGLDRALELGAEWICTIDSDDHYGAGFLSELDQASAPKRLVGKRPHSVIDSEGAFGVLYPDPVGQVHWVGGAAQGYPADLARRIRYPEVSMGEDVLFCMLAARLGYEIWDTGPNNFLYERRGGGHAWQRNARKYMALFTTLEPLELHSLEWLRDMPDRALLGDATP